MAYVVTINLVLMHLWLSIVQPLWKQRRVNVNR